MYINADYYNLVAAGGAFTVSGTLGNYTITDDDIILDSFQIDEALNSNGGLQIGGIVTSQLKLTLNNYEGKFDPDELTEESTLALTLTIGTESCPLPDYHIIDKTVTDNTIILTLLDFTDTLNAKLDSASPLTGATYLALVTDICTRHGLTVTCDTAAQSRLSASATGASFSYENATYKSVIQQITQLCNCYARIASDATLFFFFPDPTAQTIPVTSDMIASLDIEGPHYPTFVAIRGYLSTQYTASGTPGYNLTASGNPLITTPGTSAYLTAFAPLIFYNFTLDAIGDPSIQIGDYITIGGSEQCLVARKTFKLGGYMSLGFKWDIDETLDFAYASDDETTEGIIQEIDNVKESVPVVNLLPAVYYAEYNGGNPRTYRGITWTVNPDGSVTAKGTATGGNSTFYITQNNLDAVVPSITLDPTKKHTVSGVPSGGSNTTFFINTRWFAEGATPAGTGGSQANVVDTFTTRNYYKYVNVILVIYNGYTTPTDGITFYPQLEVGTEAHDYVSTHEPIAEAAKTATNFITYINSTDGIKVHNSDDTTDYIQMNSDAVSIYRDGTEVAQFGDSEIVLGDPEGLHTEINANGYDLIYGDGTELAHFGYSSTAEDVITPYTTLGERKDGTATGSFSVAEGYKPTASGWGSHAEGDNTIASGNSSHAEGTGTKAEGHHSHAEGRESTASGDNSHAEGYGTTASNTNSHAEGNGTTASGAHSHAEGYESTASKIAAHAEGRGTTADGSGSHAEGYNTEASGDSSHAEGYRTTASKTSSHAEGYGTEASGDSSHAEGYGTIASGGESHAQNQGTIANGYCQTAIGKFNVQNGSPSTLSKTHHAFIIGNGTSDTARSNAFAVDWGGNIFHQGDKPLTIASYGTCNTAAGTTTKVVTVAGGFTLTAGSIIGIEFDETNTAASPKLNVNDTGAKSIKYQATAPYTTGNWVAGQAGYVNYYMYDGTYWVFMCQSQDRNTTYTPASLGFGYGTCTTAAATAAKAVTIANYTLVVGGIVSVHFTNAVPANATLNIRTRGAKPIFYHNAAITADVITAGKTATFMYDGTNYNLIGLI